MHCLQRAVVLACIAAPSSALRASRRQALSLAAAATLEPQRALAVPVEPTFFGTLTGILFFDAPVKAEIPKGPLRPNLKTMVVFDSFNETRTKVPTLAPVGTAVSVEYALFRGGFDERPTTRGTLSFTVGDDSVNPALDELVRTLEPATQRRATVPASSNLDRSGDASKPTYLQMGLLVDKPAKTCAERAPKEPVICRPTEQSLTMSDSNLRRKLVAKPR